MEKQRICYKIDLPNGKQFIWDKQLPAAKAFIIIGPNSDDTYYLKYYDRSNLFGNWAFIARKAVRFEYIETNENKRLHSNRFNGL